MEMKAYHLDPDTVSPKLQEVGRIADESDNVLGNTALYTFRDSQLLVGEDSSGHIVGFIQYYMLKKKPKITLHKICIKKSCRRLGYGSRLMYLLFRHCREYLIQQIELKCPVDVEANLFYKQLGFNLVEIVTVKTGRKMNKWIKTFSWSLDDYRTLRTTHQERNSRDHRQV